MRLTRRVSSIEVKRTFVIAQKTRFSRRKKTKYLPQLNRENFLKKVGRAKKIVKKLTDEALNKIISDDWGRREKEYNNSMWYRGIASTKELGVWRRAGGLPSEWTCRSLAETAVYVKHGLEKNDKRIRARSKRAIPRIMEFADIIGKDKYLFPIVFAGGTGTCGRKRCRTKTRGDIDDGCMRAIAIAISGKKKLNIYFGKPKRHS